jgi:hypothetical protein
VAGGTPSRDQARARGGQDQQRWRDQQWRLAAHPAGSRLGRQAVRHRRIDHSAFGGASNHPLGSTILNLFACLMVSFIGLFSFNRKTQLKNRTEIGRFLNF